MKIDISLELRAVHHIISPERDAWSRYCDRSAQLGDRIDPDRIASAPRLIEEVDTADEKAVRSARIKVMRAFDAVIESAHHRRRRCREFVKSEAVADEEAGS